MTSLERIREAQSDFLEHFDERCARLNLADCAIAAPGRALPPLDAYAFAALRLRAEHDQGIDGEGYLGEHSHMPTDMRYRPHEVYLDAGTAIGLTRGNVLLAVGAAGIDHSGSVTIKQLQDVTGVRRFITDPNDPGQVKKNRQYYKTGLQSGLLWPDTLVRAWQHLAAMQPSRPNVYLYSNENSRWPDVYEGGRMTYDEVARNNGGVRYGRRNWILPSLVTAA